MTVVNCYNQYHLGDCIEALHFLINATKCNDVTFNFYCNPSYHSQLQEFIDNNNKITLVKIPDPSQKWINTWIGAYDYAKICNESERIFGKDSDQGTFFLLLGQILSSIMGIKCPFMTKEDMIYNQEVLNQEPSHKESYDYLFINSKNQSIPFPNFNENEKWLIDIFIKQNKKVITTAKIKDIPCTTDYGLSVVEIAKLTKNVKNIVAVNTGPIHLCMNKWTINNIDTFTVWSPAETFNYGPKFKSVKNLTEIHENDIRVIK